VSSILTLSLLQATLQAAAPLILAAMGGVISHQAGIFNFSLEGLMLFGAFFAVYGVIMTNSPLVGVLAAAVSGVIVSLIYGLTVVGLGADAIIAAFGINLLAAGATGFLLRALLGEVGGVFAPEGLGSVTPDVVANAPVIGAVLKGQSALVYLAILSGPIVALFLYRTVLGLRIRAVGEAPVAAEAAGIHPSRIQYVALALTGLLCGVAGAQLSLGFLSQFTENVTAGRGIIAFAAVIVGLNRPIPVYLAALFFGLATALTDRLQGLGFPQELIVLAPYVITVIALAIGSGRSRLLRLQTAS
jgi:general nucleoside transport system permease protein